MQSVHLSRLPPGDLFTISRLRMTSRDLEEPPLPPPHSPVVRAGQWYCSWALPGM